MALIDPQRSLRRVQVATRHIASGEPVVNSSSLGLSRSDCCGIACFVGKEDCVPYLLEGVMYLYFILTSLRVEYIRKPWVRVNFLKFHNGNEQL